MREHEHVGRALPPDPGPRLLGAMLYAAVGLAVTQAVAPVLQTPFFMYLFAACAFANLHFGFWPGMLALMLCSLGWVKWFTGAQIEPYEWYRLGSFWLIAALLIYLTSRLRRALDEMKEIVKTQDRFVAMASHDLRTPLTAISLTIDQLRRTMQPNDKYRNAVWRIDAGTVRMRRLVDDLLDFARIRHHGGLVVRFAPGRLSEVCEKVTRESCTVSCGKPAPCDDCRFSLRVSGDDHAMFDPLRVEQVVTNLLTNAVKHGTPNAPIELLVVEVGSNVMLVVENQGEIAQERLPHVFDPFHTGSKDARSVGLGLYIVAEVARAHGGTAKVASGEGRTRFTLSFPKKQTMKAVSALIRGR